MLYGGDPWIASVFLLEFRQIKIDERITQTVGAICYRTTPHDPAILPKRFCGCAPQLRSAEASLKIAGNARLAFGDCALQLLSLACYSAFH
jgi:hypothetical protein